MPVVNPGIRRLLASAIQRLFNGASFSAPLTHSAIPTRAASGTTATFTRATTKTWPNNDGYLVTGVAGEIGFVGARRVRNLVNAASSENLNAAGWTLATSTFTGTKLSESAGIATHYAYPAALALTAGTYIWSAEVSAAGRDYFTLSLNGGGTLGTYFNLATGAVISNIGAATGTIQLLSNGNYRVSTKAVLTAASYTPLLLLSDGSAAVPSYAGDTSKGVNIFNAQLEDVTAQTTQTAGEYVSVGVASSPYYHGSMVDGVKCFPTDLDGNALPTRYTYDAVSLNGVAGTYVSTPDSAAASITGDIDIRCEYSGDWTPSAVTVWGGKFLNSGQYSWRVYTDTSGTKWHFQYSIDGTAAPEVSVTATAPFADNVVGWWRVTRESVTGYVNFYTSPDGAAWTPLGTQQTGSAGALYNGTDPVQFGTSAFPLSGKIYSAQIYNGINGTLAVDFDASRYAGGTTLTGSTGETWTLNGNAVIHPTNSPMLGYSAEGARTNLALGSNDLANPAYWTVFETTATANQAVGSDGATSLAKVAETAVTQVHLIRTVNTPTAINSVYTGSIELKEGTQRYATLLLWGVTSSTELEKFTVDLQTGTKTTSGTVPANCIIESTANGTYRCKITGTTTGTDVNVNLYVYLSNNGSNNPSYAGDTGKYIYAGKGQIELGSFASSYIATTTAAVTRNADVLTYSGGDVPNLKTLCATFRRESGVTASGLIVELNDNTANERALMYVPSGTLSSWFAIDGGVTQVDSDSAYTAGTTAKQAVSFATNDVKMSKNGATQAADTSATIPTVTQLDVGHTQGTFQLSGNVGGIYGWTRNLSQSELNAVTA